MNLHTDKFAIIYDRDTNAYMLYQSGTYFWRFTLSDLLANPFADKWFTQRSLLEIVHACDDYEVLYSYPTREDFIDAHPELLL